MKGSPLAVREQVRASGWEDIVGSVLADLQYGARRLRTSPGFTAASIITLTLGIGASTASIRRSRCDRNSVVRDVL